MTIRSNPPGALAYVDDYEIGITPITTPFIYYGDRKIRLVKDGYETLTEIRPVGPPWYEVPPLDFVSENLVPGKLRDQRTLDFQLQPQAVVPTDQLLGRAEALRRSTAAPSPDQRFAPLPGGPPPAPGAPIHAAPLQPGPPLGGPAPAAAPPPGGQPLYPLPASVPAAGG
jgi:hypothetical protein